MRRTARLHGRSNCLDWELSRRVVSPGAGGPRSGASFPGISSGLGRAMAEKSRRRQMLEQSLSEAPDDLFLRYGLALQCLRDGDVDEGRQRLKGLIADDPDRQIAAYQQLGQSYADHGET